MFKFHCRNCGSDMENINDLNGKPCPKCGQILDFVGGERLAPGERLGGFEIVRLIGSGGTGNVYQAEQLSMGRQVALKVLYSELTKDENNVNQFFAEIRTLGNIQHPNIVCAFESGLDRGFYYLAMQLIDGLPLDEHMAENGALPVDNALSIVFQIATALKSVWDKYHLCHRDIKPGNIMLNEDGEPRLLDFGAVLRAGDSSICNGQIEGSPYYMSPEQARGEGLTFASDLYSLGATLYHLIVGVPPYDDPDVTVILQKQCSAPFPLPEQRNPDAKIPVPVVSLMQKMMAKKPEERFESWNDFLADLKRVRLAIRVTEPVIRPEKKKTFWKKIFPFCCLMAMAAACPAGHGGGTEQNAFSVKCRDSRTFGNPENKTNTGYSVIGKGKEL